MTEQLEARTLLTAFTVDSFFDTVDQNPGDMLALDATGQTSLRTAIMEANAVAGFDTIMLGGGIYRLAIEGTDEDSAASGDLDITDDLLIQGESSQTTIIDARDLDRVFEVRPGATLQLSDLTITGGDLAGRGDGGGIRVDNGMLQLNNVVVIGNRASNGGGIHNNLGIVTVNNSTLVDNRAEGMPGIGQGGAIDSLGGTFIVQQSTVNDNFALVAGGGIASSADTLGGSLSIENSTIAQNNAGDFQPGQGDGGGLYIQASVNATILASTIAFNTAGNEGGGVWLNGSLTLERTIVGNNIASGTGPEGFINSGSVTSNGFNLVREDTNFNVATTTGDQVGTFTTPIDPNLLGLADNGGPTQTIALGGMSPAIDAGPMIASPLFADQRGFDRERDGDRNSSVITDIGAFELQSPSDFFVDAIGTGVISEGRAGDYAVTMDNGEIGILDAGDVVTFDPDGQPIFNVEFGVRAFGTIGDALTRVRMGTGDSQNEIVLGAGVYTGSLNLDLNGLTLRGHTGNPADVVIDGGGAATAVSITEDSVSLASLRVTNATTGIDVAPMSSAQFFDADNIHIDGTTDGLKVVDSIGLMDVSIQNSTFSNNSGNGVNITNVGSAFLRNIISTTNGQDGVEVVSTPLVGLDTVTVDQNSGRGLVVDGADTIAVVDPRTSASTNGNVFSNSAVVMFRGVAGDVANSTTVTDTEIHFDAGMGFTQEAISLTNVDTLFMSGDGGNDILAIDYSAGNPPSSRQLFLDAGPGNDTIISINDANQELTDDRLTIGGIDEVAITSFEQAVVTGGAGNNKLDATGFEGPVTLSGLSGNDTLLGSSGDDVLDGGMGDDILGGGPLHEQYVLGSTAFESLDLVDSDMDVTTILDETDTDVTTIDLMSNVFRFNDVEYSGNSLFVAPSGVASFHGPVFPQNNFDLTNVPNTIGGVPIIAPLFDDWVTGLTGFPGFMLPDSKVLFKFEDLNADEIADRLIVEWNEVYHRNQIDMMTTPMLKAGASPVTFQMILELNTFDRDGDITFNYVDLNTGTGFPAIADGASATIGGKDGGDHAGGVEQFSFNSLNPLIGSNQAVIGRSAESDGDDLLTGGSGDDILFSTSGIDSLDGGAGTNDRLVFAGLNNDPVSNHTINGLAIESRVFEDEGRFYDFKTSYFNIESLDIGFGPSDQNVLVELNGLPANLSIDSGGSADNDTVVIQGTMGDDAVNVNGNTVTFGPTTLTVANVEGLNLFTGAGDDTVNVTASGTGPVFFFADGGPQNSADALSVDAQMEQAIDTGSSITFSAGLQSVSYGDFETVAISNSAPTIDDDTFAVAEDAPIGTTVGTANASDPEAGESLIYRILSGNTGNAFSISASTGEISVNSALDFETLTSYALTVQVTDPGMLSASAVITVNINDLNEAPILDPVGDRLAQVDQELTFTATATDPDSPPSSLTFSLGDEAPLGASITSDGDFTFTPTMAHDGMSFSVTVIVTEDTGGLMASETILISVSNVDLDFGDAPASFRTTFSDDGPRHVLGPLFLGTRIDAEADGLPGMLALGDDNDSSLEVPVDDEDGITFLSALNIGRTRQFRVLTSAAGFLDSWIDFDQDGVFAASENLSPSAVVIANVGGPGVGGFTNSTGIAVPAGFSTVSFDIPNSAAAGLTYARFRFSSAGGLGPMGLAGDGEVEDYRVEIIAPPPGNSSSIEPALDTAVDGFFDAFPDELNDPDPNITGDELPLAVQAENGAKVERRNGVPPLNQTDPALRTVVQAINEAVDQLEQNRAPNENILVIATHPVDFLLTDTQGRSVGFTQAAGTINEIGDDATFTGDGVVELLTIRNADPGEYSLQLVGVGGVFRGGASLLTPAGTQQITFQGSLAQNDDVELALTYQEGLLNIPSRSDLDDVNFSEIADLVAQIPTEENDAATLAAGATEALASIALDRLDASVFSRNDHEELSLQQLLKQLSETHQRLLDAIETSLDDDDFEELKRVFGDTPEDEDNVEVLTRVLLETLSGPLISVPRQVDDLSGSLQQLLEQLREQQQNRPASRNNQQAPNSTRLRDAARPERTDNRTSQRSSESKTQESNRSAFIAGNNATETIREPGSGAAVKNDALSIDAGQRPPGRPKFLASKTAETPSRETVPEEPSTTESTGEVRSRLDGRRY